MKKTMMKKLLAMLLALTLVGSVTAFALAEEAPQMAGGWLVCEDGVMTEEAQKAFDKAIGDIRELYDIQAVRLLGTQVVAGTNYSILALSKYQGTSMYSVLTIYEDLQGNAVTTGEEYIQLGGAYVDEEESTQNPAMEYIGLYQDSVGQRASLTIQCVGEDLALLELEWANSAFDGVMWTLTCELDPEAKVFTYKDGVRKEYTCDESGTITYGTITQGLKGSFTVKDDGSIVWNAEGEDANNGCVFVYCE